MGKDQKSLTQSGEMNFSNAEDVKNVLLLATLLISKDNIVFVLARYVPP